MQAVTKAPEYFLWSYTTVALCALGWLTHWLASWGKAWKLRRRTLGEFIAENPPALLFSIAGALSFYIIGPQVLPVLGVDFGTMTPATAAFIANFGAWVIGFGSDWLVYLVATMLRRATGSGDRRDPPQ